MSTALKRRNRPRRGVTLVEMLVVVALVVLMMVILVQIFQSALGAMSASRTTQELDVVLRSIDSMLRSDLAGVTAKMTPPNDPALKQGYFEYAENSPADAQGEDTDDFIAFTTKAPEGQFFTGRQFLSQVVNRQQLINQAIQPATINSQVAEVIYFWRNGNLYRRVFLVAPDRANSLKIGPVGALNGGGFLKTPIFGNSLNAAFGGLPDVSWLGFNDISARPAGFTTNGNIANNGIPIPNDLGDLTNRENRAFRPRFMNDLNPRDGIPDDNNADGVNDYYPTLYFNGQGTPNKKDANNNPIWSPNLLTSEILGYPNAARVEQTTANSYDVYAFPFIYPGMYSLPDQNRANNGLGWVHYQPPSASGYINHAPLDLGDTPSLALDPTNNNQRQTWWGFPTWRESMSGLIISNSRLGWTDPVVFLGSSGLNTYQQPLGLRPIPPNQLPTAYLAGTNLLPPIYQPGSTQPVTFFDGAGSASFVSAPTAAGSAQSLNPNPIWEDDLILTNVRSFDVKAYDPASALYNVQNGQGAFINGPFSINYQDLGYGSASYVGGLTANNNNLQNGAVPFQGIDGNGISLPPVGFGHEGRMPPLFNDFRFSPKRYGFNVGELASSPIIRMTRTFDTWSTAYTSAPDTDILLNGNPNSTNPAPIYPSFPPPYPSPLRGIQIQIRVTDPRNERTKVLTIRHDFTDKL